jgi:hypothetical protein
VIDAPAASHQNFAPLCVIVPHAMFHATGASLTTAVPPGSAAWMAAALPDALLPLTGSTRIAPR